MRRIALQAATACFSSASASSRAALVTVVSCFSMQALKAALMTAKPFALQASKAASCFGVNDLLGEAALSFFRRKLRDGRASRVNSLALFLPRANP